MLERVKVAAMQPYGGCKGNHVQWAAFQLVGIHFVESSGEWWVIPF